MEKTKLAVLDVDGTLFDGTLGIDLIKSLVQAGIFPQEEAIKIASLYQKYEDGSGDKDEITKQISQIYADSMQGNSVARVKDVAQKTWMKVQANIFDSTHELVSRLKNQGYEIVLISGSPIEMITLFAQETKIPKTNLIAGCLSTQTGHYTNQIIHHPGTAEQKIQLLDEYITSRQIEVDWTKSIGMGNNERDLLVLQRCGNSIAFEPNEALQTLAVKHTWKILNRFNILEFIQLI
jgi:phosphoserine phosphatase